jgi:SRSO17 transposase
MRRTELRDLRERLESFVRPLLAPTGRVERRTALEQYVLGLLLEGERKSLQPMAQRLSSAAEEADALRQRMQQAVGKAVWDDALVRQRLTQRVLAELPDVEALVVDDTGFPKKGRYSPAVSRQYSGTFGRTDNGQVAVSLHLAGAQGSSAIAMRLFLPECWNDDQERRKRAHIPKDVRHRKKWEISLSQIDEALSWGVPRFVVLVDSDYGDCSAYRQGLRERELPYVVRIEGKTGVWAPGTGPIPPEQRERKRTGRPPRRYKDGKDKPISAHGLVEKLGRRSCREVSWAEGTKGPQTGWFHAVRVRTARGHANGLPPGPEEWLLSEWREDGEHRLWLSSLPADTPLERLVYLAKLRWRVERDYQEMKGELGLDHFEGRTWQGFHHHATLVMVAHAFLAIQRTLFPPEGQSLDATGRSCRPAGAPDSHRGTLPPVSQARHARPSKRHRPQPSNVTK